MEISNLTIRRKKRRIFPKGKEKKGFFFLGL